MTMAVYVYQLSCYTWFMTEFPNPSKTLWAHKSKKCGAWIWPQQSEIHDRYTHHDPVGIETFIDTVICSFSVLLFLGNMTSTHLLLLYHFRASSAFHRCFFPSGCWSMLWKCHWLHASSCGRGWTTVTWWTELLCSHGNHRRLPCGKH